MSAPLPPQGDDGQAKRHELFCKTRERLAELAWRALHKRERLAILMVCIDVDDPVWGWLAKKLMPLGEPVWAEARARGQRAFARGSVRRKGAVELFSHTVPSLGPLLQRAPRLGTVHAVICAHGGASVYEIEPEEEAS
jgi:hypothetical protein